MRKTKVYVVMVNTRYGDEAYTFDRPLTDEEYSKLQVKLEKEAKKDTGHDLDVSIEQGHMENIIEVDKYFEEDSDESTDNKV